MTASSANRSNDTRGAPPGRELIGVAEAALNRWIRESTPATDLLGELAGSSFAVQVQGTSITVTLRAAPEKLALDFDAAPATATLRAAPLDLLRLLRAGGVAALKGTHAELSGDLHVAEQFSELLRLARPDLEGELARWIGDTPAHAFGEAARGAGGWLRKAAEALRMNAAEYLQEESRALPAALEAKGFYTDVERLRDDVERAAARLARLERR
jgi:ubiquinone biosynthesis accessory factor UbiJ